MNDLTLGYDGHPVLSGIRFNVQAGDYLCVVGENGSGKTTLMKTILGLQKPLSGTIAFGEGLRQNEIGYLPQQTAVQKDFPATVQEIVLSGCQARAGRHPGDHALSCLRFPDGLCVFCGGHWGSNSNGSTSGR